MAKIQGLDMRKGTILRVVKVGSERVFEFKGLRFDEFGPYDALTEPRKRKEDIGTIKIFRDSKLFDEGKIAKYGTHGASHMFWGLEKSIPLSLPSARRGPGGSAVIIGNLKAEWFWIGDMLVLPALPSDFRNSIIWKWHLQLRDSPRYASAEMRANEKLSQLQQDRKKRNLSLVLGDPLRQRLWTIDYNRAFKTISRRLSLEPIPSVIRFEAPSARRRL